MAFIDIVILVLCALGGFRGYRCGLMSCIGSLCGVVGGIVACRIFGDTAYCLLKAHTDIAAWPAAPYSGQILANLLIFVAVYAAFKAVAYCAKQTLEAVSLGKLNRLGGAAFGALKYLFWLSLVLNAVYVAVPESSLFRSSGLLGGAVFRFVMDIAPFVWGVDILPDMG